ncbi:hypothetical protein KPH14_003139 [Odynerus spinipes]|uniref:Tetratricopeptide repeat protein 19 homolog, mitochondrial n=1 Tax=Odynerus spinipes TaxID=1348599 RepID=A0AAD9RWW5_9HYME|nr:hypothetical protein KPH14_003139 [Odynerus spinipes]
MICCRKLIPNTSRLMGRYIRLKYDFKTNIPILHHNLSVNCFQWLSKLDNKEYYSTNKDTGIVCYNLLWSVTLFGLLNFGEEDKEEVPELIMTIKRSILLMQREEFKKAEQMLHVALKQAQSLQNQEAITYIYDLMANLAFDTNSLKKAETLFLSVLQRLLSSGVAENDLKVIHISLKLANIYEQKGNIQKAETGYKFCLDNLQTHLNKNPEDENVLTLLALTSYWYAQMLFSQEKYKDAYKYFEQSYDLCIKANSREQEQTVYILNYLGTISCMMQDYDKAIDYLTTAIEIGKSLPDMVHLGSVHVNLGDVLLKKGLYAEAKKACIKGRKLAKKREDEESVIEAEKCLSDIKKLMS